MITKSLIALAVEPLREAAMERAAQEARKVLIRVSDALVEHGYDARKAAPFPKSNASSFDYVQGKAWRSLVYTCSKNDNEAYNNYESNPKNPDYRKMDFDTSLKFVENAKIDASKEFDAFVAKMEDKIGEVKSAELKGSFVWGYSVMTVTKEDGSKENWKTQMIINVSKLGKLFNQFPTRKIK